MMVNYFTNITQTNNHLSPQMIESKKDHNIWHWKSRSWLGTGTNCGRVKPPKPLSILIESPVTIQF